MAERASYTLRTLYHRCFRGEHHFDFDDTPYKPRPGECDALQAAMYRTIRALLLQPHPCLSYGYMWEQTKHLTVEQQEELQRIVVANNLADASYHSHFIQSLLDQHIDNPDRERDENSVRILRELACWQGRYARPSPFALCGLAEFHREEDVPLIQAFAKGFSALTRYASQREIGEQLRNGLGRPEAGVNGSDILEHNTLGHVLSFLDPVSLVRAGAVCKAWTLVAQQDVLWLPHWNESVATAVELEQAHLAAQLQAATEKDGQVAALFLSERSTQYANAINGTMARCARYTVRPLCYTIPRHC